MSLWSCIGKKMIEVNMKLRSIVFLLLVLFAGIVANAKTLKLSKNIIYEGAVQKGFKSTKIIKDNSPKQTYHARGRMETCPLCLGSGDIKSWRDGSYNRCTTCGGKGWVIEHYW